MTTLGELEAEYSRLLAEGLDDEASRLEPMINLMARRPDTLTVALELAARGFAVFPAIGKQPDGHWPSMATTNVERIVLMWAGKPDRNIGISCKRSGLLVVDEDRPGGFAEAAASVGVTRLPETYSVATGKGRHYYFRAPDGSTLGNSPGRFAGFGCDIRGPGERDAYGGYVIAAGSTHSSGVIYTEVDSLVGVATLPEWIVGLIEDEGSPDSGELIASPGSRVKFELPAVIGGPHADSGGIRHRTIVAYSASMRAQSIPVEIARHSITAAWKLCEQPPACLTPFTEAEAQRILTDIYARHPAGPSTGKALKRPESDRNGSAAVTRRLDVAAASSIAPKRVHWAWTGRVAKGTLALLAGPEGLGKSTMGYWIAARLSRGELPGEYKDTPRAVLVCATEDAWAEVIVPRLIAAGADLDLVYRVDVLTHDDIVEGLELPTDNQAVADLAAEKHAALLLLDPLISRLAAGLDSHKDAEVRQALEPLVHMLDATGLAAIGLIHLNKSGSAMSNVLDRIMASKAFTAVARSVHVVLLDPDDETGARRLFGTAKSNLGSTALPTLGFEIESYRVETDDGPADTGRIKFGDDAAETIRDVMSRSVEGERMGLGTKEAVAWLADYLLAEGSAASADIKREAQRAGIEVAALHRARQRLNVVMTSEGFPRRTYWATADYVRTKEVSRARDVSTTATTTTTGTTV